MICIVGYARTGTSILFKSLENAGFNGGDNLFGHKYKSQDRWLQFINRRIEVGWKRSKKVPRRTQWYIDSFFSEYCTDNSIDIAKDPYWWKVFNFWVALCPDLKRQKFIWTKRDLKNAAESHIRVHNLKSANIKSDGKYTFETALQEAQQCEKMLSVYMPRFSHITLQLEDVLANPTDEYKRVSEFVGREVSAKLIDAEQTFEKNEKVN